MYEFEFANTENLEYKYVEKFPLQEMQGRRNKNFELTFTVVDILSC